MARLYGPVLVPYLAALLALQVAAERLVEMDFDDLAALSEDDLQHADKSVAQDELGVRTVQYEMLRLEEEAYFEKQSLCVVNRGRDAENPTKNDLAARALGVDLDTVKVVSIGSTSTQAYTCNMYIQGFWTGTQAESHRNPNELPRLARWLARSTTFGEHVYLIGGPGWRIPDNERARSMAPQVWPNPLADLKACGWKKNEPRPAPLTSGEVLLTPDVADGLVGEYQDALCRASCRATVHLVDKEHDTYKRYQLSNGWVDAIKVTSGFTEYKTIVDWGGSGPKPVGAREPLSFDGIVYNNNYLVEQPPGGPDRLNCNRLKKALGDVITWVMANKEGPYFIAQTGYAREKWTKGLTVQYVNKADGKLAEVGQETSKDVRRVEDAPCDFAIKVTSKLTVQMPLWSERKTAFLVDGVGTWVKVGTDTLGTGNL